VALGEEKYLLLTTYRRDGTAVSTPVWVVSLDEGKLGLWTSSASGKAKRLAHTDRVTMKPCDARGKVKDGADEVGGTATVVTGAEYETISAKVKAKYGLMTSVTKLLGAIGGMVKRKRVPYGDCGVVITPAG
jgi:PPOX class probable F420-dependent enzyme